VPDCALPNTVIIEPTGTSWRITNISLGCLIHKFRTLDDFWIREWQFYLFLGNSTMARNFDWKAKRGVINRDSGADE
jgi:hypothetical protein